MTSTERTEPRCPACGTDWVPAPEMLTVWDWAYKCQGCAVPLYRAGKNDTPIGIKFVDEFIDSLDPWQAKAKASAERTEPRCPACGSSDCELYSKQAIIFTDGTHPIIYLCYACGRKWRHGTPPSFDPWQAKALAIERECQSIARHRKPAGASLLRIAKRAAWLREQGAFDDWSE